MQKSTHTVEQLNSLKEFECAHMFTEYGKIIVQRTDGDNGAGAACIMVEEFDWRTRQVKCMSPREAYETQLAVLKAAFEKDAETVAVASVAKTEFTKEEKLEIGREIIADKEEIEIPSKGFVAVTRAKVLEAVERVKHQDFSCQIKKTATGKYLVHSFTSTNTYKVELNRGIFGVTGHCECFDFSFARLGRDEVCKHLASVYFFERRETVVSLNECERAAA